MRYSLLLPRSEPTDPEEANQAMTSAREVWALGDRREALRWVRRAAWACSKAGQNERALSLSKAAKTIGSQLEIASSNSEPPPPSPLAATQPAMIRAATIGAIRTSRKIPRPQSAPPTGPQSAAPISGPRPMAPGQLAPDDLPLISSAEEPESLVVTVAPGEWDGAEPALLVGHHAVRVAIEGSGNGEGRISVRLLKAGEVADAHSKVALLVAVDPNETVL